MPSIGQNMQPFTGNSDVPKQVKISRVGRKISNKQANIKSPVISNGTTATITEDSTPTETAIFYIDCYFHKDCHLYGELHCHHRYTQLSVNLSLLMFKYNNNFL